MTNILFVAFTYSCIILRFRQLSRKYIKTIMPLLRGETFLDPPLPGWERDVHLPDIII